MKHKSLLLPTVSAAMLVGCQKDVGREQTINPDELSGKSASEQTNVFKGPNRAIGNGHARTWFRMNHLNEPLELGIELTASALENLPAHYPMPTPDHTTIVLPLHNKATEYTPFDHIGLNWNPGGHPPPNLFMVPHFDLHFYMMSLEDRHNIPAYTPNSAFDIYPPVGYMPATYTPGPGGEIEMGKHWSLPPAQIAPFTRTMILGTYDGEFTFVEPMVTLSYLLSGATSSLPYAQPAKFAEAGYYPTVYNVYRDEKGNYNITLSNFVWRNAN